MNKKILTGIFSLFVFLFQAQINVNNAEYYWDTDPGEGNAIALAPADGNFDSAIENILQNTSSFPSANGFHTFAIRFKDSQGNWGPVFKNIVHTGSIPVTEVGILTNGEYFWDIDPGEGNAIALTAVDGNFNNAIEDILQNNIAIPQSAGFHVFHVRVKDDQGIWGPVFKNVVHTGTPSTEAVSLTNGEYFWDIDPGEGNAIALAALDSNFDNIVEDILQNNIPIAQPTGFHIFNVRVKDNLGIWGPVFQNVVYIETSGLGTKEVKLSKNIVCYPNPADDIIRFNATGKINIYSTEGRLVLSKDNADGSKGINISSLVKGNYILTIENKEGKFSSKFIKK
ncbi:T9SS type A sorting domain-containing protein [Chryseobacterium sp. MYb328]|uniref:T9SS type A sorting domain-containing protein n=1 Tax=Chryseobacterium sp. MYb328 TaxID=2745231 RepID=UPI0030ACA060